jgi:signal transduction histidine kinase
VTRVLGAVGSVRARITLTATLVTAAAVLLAGSWLVRSVEGSLTDRAREQGEARLDAVKVALERGVLPSELDLTAVGGISVQVTMGDDVLAATPEVASLPPLYTLSADGDVLRIDRRAGTTSAAGWATGGPGSKQMTLTTERVDSPYGEVRLIAASPLEPVFDSVEAVQAGLTVAYPALIGGVALLAWLLAGRALRPVEAIRTQVEAISGATLHRRVPVPSSGDEVARLALTMNAMLDRVEEASDRQQRFVADASHELRSPVTAIRTELEVALRTATPDEWPTIAERLLGEEARLEAVINDLLLLASIEESAPLPESVAIDLADLAVEEARRRRTDGVAIELDAPSPVVVDGSRMQLQRLLANLLDNAARHARTTVRVSVHERDGRVRLIVDDDGPGIREEDRERAFERFTRLDGHRAREGDAGGGAGLGLSLVRRIAERHHGTARIDTAPLGGARVLVELEPHA